MAGKRGNTVLLAYPNSMMGPSVGIITSTIQQQQRSTLYAWMHQPVDVVHSMVITITTSFYVSSSMRYSPHVDVVTRSLQVESIQLVATLRRPSQEGYRVGVVDHCAVQ